MTHSPALKGRKFWVQAAIAGKPVLHHLAHWTTPCPVFEQVQLKK
ncbi:hypothetical protein [Phormidesmis priestleyi]|nr:hypothetical protein [Phormidesmis priestleyi]